MLTGPWHGDEAASSGDRHPCAYCGQTQGWTSEATVVDDSGGSIIRICDSCTGFALTDRCGLCGTALTGQYKADGIHFGEEQGADICDRCRDRMLFGRGDLR